MKRLLIGALALTVIIACGFIGYLQWHGGIALAGEHFSEPLPQDDTSVSLLSNAEALHQAAAIPIEPTFANPKFTSEAPVPQFQSRAVAANEIRFESSDLPAPPSPPQPMGSKFTASPTARIQTVQAVRDAQRAPQRARQMRAYTTSNRETGPSRFQSNQPPQVANSFGTPSPPVFGGARRTSVPTQFFEPPADRKFVIHVFGGAAENYPTMQSSVFLDGKQCSFTIPCLPNTNGDLKIYAESVEVTCKDENHEIKCEGAVTLFSRGSKIEGKDLHYLDGQFQIASPAISTSDTKIKSSDATFSFDAQAVSVVKLATKAEATPDAEATDEPGPSIESPRPINEVFQAGEEMHAPTLIDDSPPPTEQFSE